MTVNDPFAAGPAATAEPVKEAAAVTVPAPVAGPREISATLKAHSGHNAPWLVFKGATAAEVKEMVQDAVDSGLMETVAAGAKQFAVSAGTPAPAPAARTADPAPQAAFSAPAAPAAPAGTPTTTQTCRHGVLQYNEWTGRNGNLMRAFQCPVRIANYRDPDACKDAIQWYKGK